LSYAIKFVRIIILFLNRLPLNFISFRVGGTILMIGTTLGHYRIISLLGKGGMGEVFLAHDTSLNRKVALKFLPEVSLTDPERLVRFEREAKLLASLNSPNIAAIYGLEQAKGKHFLVLEFVEGVTLTQKIAKGPLPSSEALETCRQIAQGLEAAHNQGIVHRDLKPDNVKITPEGKVKILDFGLAKAYQDESLAADRSTSSTVTTLLTQPGTILGTAAYMAPEQAKGDAVDKRADVWAFGCILYECLTRRRAFEGKTVAETLVKVLESAPNLVVVPESTPAFAISLIRRCLRKDPNARLREIADASLEIEEFLASTREGSEEHPWVRKSSLLRNILFAAALVVIGFFAWYMWTRDRVVQNPSPRYTELVSKAPLLTGSGVPPVAITKNGGQIAYWCNENGKLQMFLRRLDRPEPVPVPGAQGGRQLAFSPDGKNIAYFADGKLKRIPVEGGQPQELCSARMPYGVVWLPNGNIVYNPHGAQGLWQIPEKGGTSKPLTIPDYKSGEFGHGCPSSLLPDGKSLLFYINYMLNRYNIAILDLETGKYRVVLENTTYAVYSPTGHLVFSRADGLYAVPFDAKSRTTSGNEVALLRDLWSSGYYGTGFALSQNGTLVYRSGKLPDSELVLVDMKGNETVVPTDPRKYMWPRFSPKDENLIAVNIGEPKGFGTWLVYRSSGRLQPLNQNGSSPFPVWTSDGKKLVFVSDQSGAGQWKTYSQNVDAGSPPELIFDQPATENNFLFMDSITRDSRSVIVSVASPQNNSSNVISVSLDKKPSVKMLIPGGPYFGLECARLSPDEDILAYVSNKSGSKQVYVARYPEMTGEKLVSEGWGQYPVWARDGERIYYLGYKDGLSMMYAEVKSEPALSVSPSKALFNFPYELGVLPNIPNWDLSPDGDFWVAVRAKKKDFDINDYHLNRIENFFTILKAGAGR
jgi:Tol biopolymer transport system component